MSRKITDLTNEATIPDAAELPWQVAGSDAKTTTYAQLKTLLSALYAEQGYESELSSSTPAAEANAFLATIKSAGSSPDVVSIEIKRSDIEGVARIGNLQGSAWVKTLVIPAGAFKAKTTGGAAVADMETTTNDVNLDGFDFDAASTETISWQALVPGGLSLTTMTAQFIWTDGTTAGTGDVVWQAAARVYSNDDAIDQAMGTAQTVTDTFIASGDKHLSAATAAITPAGGTIATGDLLVLEVARLGANGSDTYTQDARLLGVILNLA